MELGAEGVPKPCPAVMAAYQSRWQPVLVACLSPRHPAAPAGSVRWQKSCRSLPETHVLLHSLVTEYSVIPREQPPVGFVSCAVALTRSP